MNLLFMKGFVISISAMHVYQLFLFCFVFGLTLKSLRSKGCNTKRLAKRKYRTRTQFKAFNLKSVIKFIFFSVVFSTHPTNQQRANSNKVYHLSLLHQIFRISIKVVATNSNWGRRNLGGLSFENILYISAFQINASI